MTPRNPGRPSRIFVLCCPFLMLAAGCGISWDCFDYETCRQEVATNGKLLFVYFKHWSVVECTEFEETVLKDPAVLRATEALHCLPLDYNWDRPLAEQWNVAEVPAVVLLTPSGRVVGSVEGLVGVAELLSTINDAQRAAADAPQ